MKRTTPALLALIMAAAPAAAQSPSPPALPCDSAGACARTVTPTTQDRAAAGDLSDLLAGRIPGVYVRRVSGTAGASSRIVIRGLSHLFMPESPLVVVDGIRVGAEEAVPSMEGMLPVSAIDELDPEQVDSVRVLPGPAAAAKYGPAAATGVIEITTRRGAGSGFHASGFAGVGARQDAGDYPANWFRPGTGVSGARTRCTLYNQSAGFCTPRGDSLYTYNPLEQSSPFRTGTVWTAGARVDGGAGPVSYLAYASHGSEQGVLEENSGVRTDLQGRLGIRPVESLEISATGAYLSRDLRLPYEPGTYSVLAAGLYGGARGDSLQGYRGLAPVLTDFYENTLNTRRTRATVRAAWTPRAWLRLEGRYGMDRAARDGVGTLDPIGASPGSVDSTVSTVDLRTAAGTAQLRFQLLAGLSSLTEAGVERTAQIRRFHEGQRALSTPGGFNLFDSREQRRVVGAWLSEGLGWRGTVRLDGVYRLDTPRGADALHAWSVSGAWEVGAEPFFRRPSWLGGVRLRAAYGSVESSPLATLGQDVGMPPLAICPAAGPCNFGFDPERTKELEGGVAGELLGHLSLELTGYRRETSKLLQTVYVQQLNQDVLQNLGTVRNTGVEGALRIDRIATGPATWSFDLAGAANRNRVTKLVYPLVSTQRVVQGYPLGGYWARPILGFQDPNGDGLLRCTAGACDVTLGDTAVFAGNAFPARMLGAGARVQVGALALGARVEHQGGYRLFDQASYLRCSVYQNCRADYDPATPLAEQAGVLAAIIGSPAAYIHDASFTRLREVTLSFSAPRGVAGTIGASAVELTLAGRNLATWTSYPGLDPEVNTAGIGLTSAQGATQPLPRTWVARVDLRF
jgi:hypothetical protein